VAATGKPMIISTGMASVAELDESVRTARAAGCRDLVLLKCTSTYPATPENTNIRTIPHLRDLFGCEVGLSDHTMGTGVSVASVALGATVIEKHFTLSRADGGVDSAFSMEPAEMASLVLESERAWQALGRITYGAERKSLQFRRTLYITEALQRRRCADNRKPARHTPRAGPAAQVSGTVPGQACNPKRAARHSIVVGSDWLRCFRRTALSDARAGGGLVMMLVSNEVR
jgi:hypothetical protein